MLFILLFIFFCCLFWDIMFLSENFFLETFEFLKVNGFNGLFKIFLELDLVFCIFLCFLLFGVFFFIFFDIFVFFGIFCMFFFWLCFCKVWFLLDFFFFWGVLDIEFSFDLLINFVKDIFVLVVFFILDFSCFFLDNEVFFFFFIVNLSAIVCKVFFILGGYLVFFFDFLFLFEVLLSDIVFFVKLVL